MLIDVTIPTDRNVVQMEEEKKSLCVEIQRMWNIKCKIIPVIIGATGILTDGWRKHLEAVPGKLSIDSLQKTATLETSHIIWTVMQPVIGILSGGDQCWFRKSTREKRPVTRDNNNNIIIIIVKFPIYMHKNQTG